MKIGLYSPYVPVHAGGGEKYFFDVARSLADLGHQVIVLLENQIDANENFLREVKEKYQLFLGTSLDGITFQHSPLGAAHSALEKLQFTKQFDMLYLVTDGSLFFSLAKKNILHIQIPFTQSKTSFIDKLKLSNWSIRNANSQFTQHVVEKSWQTHIQFVHYPMIDIPQATYEEKKKEKVILSVGRFFDHLHSKRQDVLVTAFKEMVDRQPKLMKGWKLVLVGPIEDSRYAERVKELAKGYSIELHHSLSRTELLKYYQQATFYWHAAGFEVDEQLNPEKVEHFGISTVEAMNFGCIPLPVGKGGQIEVLGSSLKNLAWQKTEELTKMTASIIENDELRHELAEKAVTRAKNFGKDPFIKTLTEMIK